MDANQNQAPATDPQAATTDTPAADEQRTLHATRSDAEANRPAKMSKNHKVYGVTKGGTVLGYIWAHGYADCAQWASRREDYKFSLGKAAVVTVEAAAAKLATLDDATLAALGLTRTTTTPPAAPPAPSTKPTRGRK